MLAKTDPITPDDVKPVLSLYRRHLFHIFTLTAFLTALAVADLFNGNVRHAIFISTFSFVMACWGAYYTWIYFSVAHTIGQNPAPSTQQKPLR